MGCTHAEQTTDTATTHRSAATAQPSRAPRVAPTTVLTPGTVAPIVTVSAAPAVAATQRPASTAASLMSSPVPAPAIYSVSALPGVAREGQSVVWDVRTSRDIVSVSARTSAITLPLQRLSAGHFGLTFAIPRGVPGFFHGTYDFDVSAVSAAGSTLHRDLALRFE